MRASQEFSTHGLPNPGRVAILSKASGADIDRELPPTETSPVLELAGDEFGFGALVFELAKPARVC